MSVKDAILTTRPTSYWPPTTSAASSSCHDEMVAHLAIWNRLLSGDEIASIWSDGASDLGTCAMYHSFV